MYCRLSSPRVLPARRSHELLFYAVPELVAYPPEDGEPLFLRTRGLRGILQRPVQPPRSSREERARLVGVVADRDHVVEGPVEVAVQGLGLLPRDVHADLPHPPDRQRPYVGGLRARAPGLEVVPRQMPQQPLRHLRARGVVGAQEKDPACPRRLSSSHRQLLASRGRRAAGRRPRRGDLRRFLYRGSRSSSGPSSLR